MGDMGALDGSGYIEPMELYDSIFWGKCHIDDHDGEDEFASMAWPMSIGIVETNVSYPDGRVARPMELWRGRHEF